MRRGTDLIVGGEIVLSGYILTDDSAGWMWDEATGYFCPAMLREALSELGDGEVTIRLTSVGGEVVAGETMRAMIAGHPGGVRIVVEGQASSAASLMFMGATRREMSEGSYLMIHNPSGGGWGEADELRRQAAVLDKLGSIYAAVYARASGKTVEEVLAIMAAETWYSAEEAIAEGFCDAVSGVEAARAAGTARMTLAQHQSFMAERRAAFMAARQAHLSATGAMPARNPAATGGNPPAQMSATAQEALMPDPTPAAAAAVTTAQPVMAAAPDTAAILAAERARSAEIRTAAQPFMAAGRLTETDVSTLIAEGVDVTTARSRMFETMAAREPVAPAPVAAVTQRGRDETETRRLAMEDALVARLSRGTPSEPARQYMDHALFEMAAIRMGLSRVGATFAAREQVLMSAFHSTSDFPLLFENALNRSLAARYAMAQPTYRRIARQRSYADFRDHSTVRMGDFPTLQLVNPEAGEIGAGTFSESKEKTAVKAYGVQVLFSRQMMVNDTLGGIDQVLNDRGAAVARFEEGTFYAMALGGANGDGPTLLETTRQVFNTTDGTKAATGTAITVAAVGAGRSAMRKQKSIDKSDLDLVASILLVGPDKQLEAEQLVAPIAAAQTGNVNPFSGRLQVETTAKITGNAWYLFADASVAPCFEWGLLEGYTAPRFRIENPFGTQGTAMSLEHDFGCGAIDFRGGYKNAGN